MPRAQKSSLKEMLDSDLTIAIIVLFCTAANCVLFIIEAFFGTGRGYLLPHIWPVVYLYAVVYTALFIAYPRSRKFWRNSLFLLQVSYLGRVAVISSSLAYGIRDGVLETDVIFHGLFHVVAWTTMSFLIFWAWIMRLRHWIHLLHIEKYSKWQIY